MTPTVLYEDNHCLALLKPAGLLTQGVPEGLPTLEAAARDYLRTTYNKAGRVYLGIPHRLDRPVSGVVLFARSSKAAARLAEQFRERQVRTIYLALVGRPDGCEPLPDEGVWEDHLLKVADEARTVVTTADAPGAKAASLKYRVVRRLERSDLLEIELHTGRMHQIRVQAASRGRPVLGDTQYGSREPFGPAAELERDRAVALHGHSLTFLHPIRYEPVTVVAPVPEGWPSLTAG